MKTQEGLEILELILLRTKFYMVHAQPTVLGLQTVNVAPLNLMEMPNLTLVASNAGGSQESLPASVQE